MRSGRKFTKTSQFAGFSLIAWGFSACVERAEHPFPATGGSAGLTSATGGVAAPVSGGSGGGTTSSGGSVSHGGTAATSSGGKPSTTGGMPSAGTGGLSTTGGKSGSGGRAGSGGTSNGGGSAGKNAGGGGSSGGQSAGNGSCADEDYLICEDFEDTELGGVPEGWTRHGELAKVSDDAAKSGKHSLKLEPAEKSERRIYHDAELLGSAHWGRIHYKVKQPVPDAFVHSTLVSFMGEAPTRGRSEFRTIDTVKQAVDTKDVGSKHQYLYNVQVVGSSEFAREGPYDQVFEDSWHCVEYSIDASNQSYALYVDGEEELSFMNGEGNYDRSEIPEVFEELRVGWVNYQAAPPGFTAWIDEIAFDDERIGCD